MNGYHGTANSRMHMSDGEHPLHVHYQHQSQTHGLQQQDLSNDNGLDEGNHANGGDVDDNDDVNEGIEADVNMPQEGMNAPDNHAALLEHGGDDADQLTLSFQGQVYVFDSVSPQKVISVK